MLVHISPRSVDVSVLNFRKLKKSEWFKVRFLMFTDTMTNVDIEARKAEQKGCFDTQDSWSCRRSSSSRDKETQVVKREWINRWQWTQLNYVTLFRVRPESRLHVNRLQSSKLHRVWLYCFGSRWFANMISNTFCIRKERRFLLTPN